MVADSENVGIAFALVIAAGASTALGASVVFFPSLVKLASKKTLAGGLGLSAGVMTYVSFVEIFAKSVLSFGVDGAGLDENKAYGYATICFFAGVVCMVLLNLLVHHLLGFHHGHFDDHQNHNTQEVSGSDNEEIQPGEKKGEEDGPLPPCCTTDPGAQIDRLQQMAAVMEAKELDENEQKQEIDEAREDKADVVAADDENKEETKAEIQSEHDEAAEAEAGALRISKRESQKLSHMSLNTAVAIALHNFPEGLATFVATLEDPKVGAVLAIAIAIHNVPEGLCVAMPVYYATGSRWRAFGWALLSGISEPIAAFFGWLVLANSFSDTLYAILFGMVAGMMVIISVRELLPTAHRYDPEDSVVTNMYILGMAIMALSLVLFIL
ncbi:Zinc transporter ZupT [Seminavis robusta]|uniref:Zinc transporter ZupT n=1 Tax=Seminavis robusta TaxID=568900 RepID=A0A9N8EIW5_9STRA|nr:Zinc transporter ZupT [Seminavis robusta]|eukprot:Sro1174_g249080.1 Zinc transporter ZupT (383) ;mRNA; f:28511-29953